MGRLALVLATTACLTGTARADESGGFLIGYGQLFQTRQDVDSMAHLLQVGFGGRLNDDLLLIADLQFGIDDEYGDFSHLGISMMAAYGVGPSAITFWVGGGLRFALDGYPNPSAAVYDPGVGVGILSQFDGFGFGIDARGWLGMNFYCDRISEEIEFSLDPYFEWRAYVSIGGF